MEKIFTKGVIVGFFLFCLLFAPRQANAYLISVDFTAEVSGIYDPRGYLTGHIGIGNIFSGTYSYETETPDTNTLPHIGDYRHVSSPYGVSFDINGYQFRTDPDNVDFILELGNDLPSSKYDFYLFHSYNNLFDLAVTPLPEPELSDLPPRNVVSFYLHDATGTALSSTEIPLEAPVLAEWTGRNYMIITSESDMFAGEYFYIIDANLLSVTPSAPVPEPSTIILFTSGVAVLLVPSNIYNFG